MQLKRPSRSNMKEIVLNQDLEYRCSSSEKELTFNVASNSDVSLLLSDIEEMELLNFEVSDNATLHLAIFAQKFLKNVKITANIGENSKIIVYFADFTVERNHLDASINLNKDNARAEWHLASLSTQKDDKEIAVNIYHNSPNTHGRIDNYGVCKENSKLIFAGISHIIKGCHQSTSHQNAKIVVFDDDCKAIARPILKIDENDIEASHAAVVGKVNDEHIFYLTSRGLSVEDAKLLITLGYLKPILKGFNEQVREQINSLIEGRL